MDPKKKSPPDTEEEASPDAIAKAVKSAQSLTAEDFEPMNGVKIPTEAEDGETVTLMVTGTAKGGFIAGARAAECGYGYDDDDSKEENRGRIKVMIMSGKDEEE